MQVTCRYLWHWLRCAAVSHDEMSSTTEFSVPNTLTQQRPDSMHERSLRARDRLRAASLRCTDARIAVLSLLEHANGPATCSDVADALGEDRCDPATVYRTLVTLADHGIAHVVSWAEGMAHYELASSNDDEYAHAHFHCVECASVTCLPADQVASGLSPSDPWRSAVARAQHQLHGVCPDCTVDDRRA